MVQKLAYIWSLNGRMFKGFKNSLPAKCGQNQGIFLKNKSTKTLSTIRMSGGTPRLDFRDFGTN